MPKRSSDISDQIFDFIFEQQKKEPDKRKPVKPSGIAGDSELVNSMAAVLENPAQFNLGVITENFEESLNIKLAEFRLSEDNIKKGEVGLASMVSVLRDPVGYASKIRNTAKAIRKSMNAKYAGAAMSEFVLSSYLYKTGYSKELRKLIKNNAALASRYKQIYEFTDFNQFKAYASGMISQPMISGGQKGYFVARTARLAAKDSVGRARWESLSSAQRDGIVKTIVGGGDIQRAFESTLGTTAGSTAFTNFSRGRYSLGREDTYRALEVRNLSEKSDELERRYKRGGDWIDKYAQQSHFRINTAKELMQNTSSLAFIAGDRTADIVENFNTYARNIGGQITQAKDHLKDARRLRDSDSIALYKDQLKVLQNAQRSMYMVGITGNIGQIEGYINSIKSYYNINSIFTGDFYKNKKNQFFCPAGTAKVSLLDTTKVPAVEIFVPAKSKYKVMNNYNRFMVGVYYMTPLSLFKTFFYNGEGFAWVAYNLKSKISNDIAGLTLPGLTTANLDSVLSDSALLNSVLGSIRTSNPKIYKLLSRYKKNARLTKTFSLPFRFQEAVLEEVGSKVFKGIREKIADAVLTSKLFIRFGDEVSIAFVNMFKQSGGIYGLIKGIFTAISKAIGLTMSPVVELALAIVSNFVVEKIYDVMVPIFGLLVFALFGIIGFFTWAGYSVNREFNRQFTIHANTIPGGVGYCDVEELDFIEPDYDYDPGIIIPPPNNSSCPVGSTISNCSQGFTRTTCSHKNYTHKKPVDLTGVTYFYAPQYCAESTCKVTGWSPDPVRASDKAYVGQGVVFDDGQGNVFSMLHVKFLPPSNGSTYGPGEPVAYIYQSVSELIRDDTQGLTASAYANRPEDRKAFMWWTGPHLHITTTQNGNPVDPIALMSAMGCGGLTSAEECDACN